MVDQHAKDAKMQKSQILIFDPFKNPKTHLKTKTLYKFNIYMHH